LGKKKGKGKKVSRGILWCLAKLKPAPPGGVQNLEIFNFWNVMKNPFLNIKMKIKINLRGEKELLRVLFFFVKFDYYESFRSYKSFFCF